MPFEPHHVPMLPTAWHIVLRTLMYTAATLLSAFGGLRGYRVYRSNPYLKQDARAQALRDEIVFAEDFDQLHLGDDVEGLKRAEEACVFRPGVRGIDLPNLSAAPASTKDQAS